MYFREDPSDRLAKPVFKNGTRVTNFKQDGLNMKGLLLTINLQLAVSECVFCLSATVARENPNFAHLPFFEPLQRQIHFAGQCCEQSRGASFANYVSYLVLLVEVIRSPRWIEVGKTSKFFPVKMTYLLMTETNKKIFDSVILNTTPFLEGHETNK